MKSMYFRVFLLCLFTSVSSKFSDLHLRVNFSPDYNVASSFDSGPITNSTPNYNLTSSLYSEQEHNSTENSTSQGHAGHLEFCLTDEECGNHQVCVDGRCFCEQNFIWNETLVHCQYIKCNSTSECQAYDENRFCSKHGQCSCNTNTMINPSEGWQCSNITCSRSIDCPNLNCQDGICICPQGYKMNNERGKCERFHCSSSEDCHTYDKNMFCDTRDGQCHCKHTYIEDDRHKSCIQKPCISCYGENQVCHGGFGCYCQDNYILSGKTGECELNSCENSTDCQSRDENSFCLNGICSCKTNFQRASVSDQKCSQYTCTSSLDCLGIDSFCVDGLCECGPNYRLSNISGKCELFSCEDTHQCQDYDPNRFCSNGTCKCDSKMFVPDQRNGYKCTGSFCRANNDCPGNTSVCVNNHCRCAPNYVYNANSQKCEYYKCLSDPECYNQGDRFDSRICQHGQCVCRNGSNPDQSNGGKCVEESASYNNSCLSHSSCDEGFGSEKCVDSICRCAPNYRYIHDLKKCRPFSCNQTSDCTEYDPKRVCNTKGRCNCSPNYVDNAQNGDICISKSVTYDKRCTAQNDCYESGQRCVDNVCRCKPNYWWNSNTQKCEYFRCNSDLTNRCSDDVYDSHRYCDPYGSGCVCGPLYEQDASNGYKCVFNTPIIPTFTPITIAPSTYTYRYNYNYLYVVIPVIFFGSLAGRLYRKKRVLRLKRFTQSPVRTTAQPCAEPPAQPPPYKERTNPC